jgi:hypothetical protein
MRTRLLYAVLLVTCIFAGTIRAQEKFDPAMRAKTIAPFIDEQTFLVAHVDATRVNVEATFDQYLKLLPPDLRETIPADEIEAAKKAVSEPQERFLKAGGKDAYVVSSIADIPPASSKEEGMIFVIVPLREGAKEKELLDIVRDLPFEVKERWGDNLFLGSKETQQRLKKNKPDPRPELVPAFEAAGDTAAQAVLLPPKYVRRVIEEIMPTLPEPIDGKSTILTDGLLWAALGVDLPPRISARLVVQSKDRPAAEALKQKWSDIYQIIGKEKETRELVPAFDEIVKRLTPAVQGDRLSIVLDEKNINQLITSAIEPALLSARQEAQKTASKAHLRQIAVAMQMYEAQNKSLPAPASYDGQGKPLLSWRVHVLPFLGQQKLYEKFHLNEPWDSENNKKLIAEMPDLYQSPMSKLKEKGRTNYLLPTGKDTLFPGREGPKLKDIKNPAHTILIVEVDDEHAIPWTKPDDLPFDAEKPWTGLKGPYLSGFPAAYCDGHVEMLSYENSDNMIRHNFVPQK